MPAWDASVDFLVVGSGAAGMTAALRAHDLGGETLVVEKAPVYGGNTALSGGVVWVPGNPLMRHHGIADSPAEALRYLEKVTASTSAPERLRAYVTAAPRMMAELGARSHVQFACVPDYPDYYPEEPGGKPGGRSCEPLVFDALALGDEFDRMRVPPIEKLVFGGRLTIRVADGRTMLEGGLPAAAFLARELWKYHTNLRARRRGRRNTRLAIGTALVGRLRLSLLERAVPLWLETPLRTLVAVDGRVAGARLERAGRPFAVEARRGVLLAAGGFERNGELRRRFQAAPTAEAWSAGCETNVGDTIALGAAAGAALDLMDDAWWCPTLLAPAGGGSSVAWIVIFEKNLAGGIIVGAHGRRFMNEAAPYYSVVRRMYDADRPPGTTIPAFLVFDARYRRSYPCGPVLPAAAIPDALLSKEIEGGFFVKDRTLDGLARRIGVDPAGLVETVARFNAHARAGVDPDFHRGESLQDRFYSAKVRTPNPNLGEIATPPFYAVRILPGDLGTKGGFRTDAHARVLSEAGVPIPGLYAAGNCSASVMGRSYPGAGATIGPAMTFGFLAAEHALGAAP